MGKVLKTGQDVPETARIGKAVLEAPGLGRDAPSGHNHDLGDRGGPGGPEPRLSPVDAIRHFVGRNSCYLLETTHADHQGAVSSSRSRRGPG